MVRIQNAVRSFVICVGFSLALTACLSNSSEQSTSSAGSTDVAAEAAKSCEVQQNNGEVRLVCGDSSAVINVSGNSSGVVGPQGPQGPQGLTGAQGPQGEQGQRGPTGAGSPSGMVIRDGSDVAARFLQYSTSAPQVLVMYDGGETIWLNTKTGKFAQGLDVVYFSGLNCTGTAYLFGGQMEGPFALNQVYSGFNDYGVPVLHYKVTGFTSTQFTTQSRKTWNSHPNAGYCQNTSANSIYNVQTNPVAILQELPLSAYTDLSRLAPLKIEVE